MLEYIWILFLIVTAIIIFFIYVTSELNEKPIPGPQYALRESDVFSRTGGGLANCVMKLHEQYGPIVCFTLETMKLVSIGSPELFKEHQHVFDRPVELFLGQIPIIGEGSIQIANGDRGKFLHKSLSRPFSFLECENYYPILRQIGGKFIDKLESLPKASTIPLQEYMLILTVKEVAHVSFGYEFEDDDIARQQIQNYNDAFGELFYDDEHRNKDQDKVKILGIRKYRQFLKNALDNRLKTRHLDSHTYFVDTLLDMGLEKDEELDNAVTFFTGAFHTTANLLTWLFYYLGQYQPIQDKVRAELETVLLNTDVDHKNFHQLKYLHQVIDETLRHTCLAPFAARCSEEDVRLGGHNILANTPVIHCLGYSLMDPKYWSTPETLPPAEFDPERFSVENSKHRPKLSFEPFGFAGKRICPGYRFAYVVVIVLVSLILRRFRVKLAEGQKIKKVIGFVTKPNAEIKAYFDDLTSLTD
ncbi:hypothetical protein CHUAL_001892 [Chamberlinius hualienensis]